jgi:hypothetical protein
MADVRARRATRGLDLLGVAGVLLVCASSALSAVIEMLLVPLYAGAVLVPVAVLLAVGGNIVLPRLARVLVPTGRATLAPFAAWLLVVLVVGLFPRPEGDVIIPGGGGAVQWTGYGVLLGGALAGTLTVVLTGAGRPPTE